MKYLIIIIMAFMLAIGNSAYAADKERALPRQEKSPEPEPKLVPEPVPQPEPAFEWEGELNPNEFDNWKILGVRPSPQEVVWVYIKNPDEESPIDSVAMALNPNDMTLIGYRYFKYGIPHQFKISSNERRYIRKALTDKQKEGCMKCHEGS